MPKAAESNPSPRPGSVRSFVASCAAAVFYTPRANLIHDVYGKGPGVLPTQHVPDKVLTW